MINVSWQDARDYAAWLSAKTGKEYRLPTEAEWEYAARAGTTTRRYWDETPDQKPDPACAHANVFDRGNIERIEARYGAIGQSRFLCEDPYPFTAPVGAAEFNPNPWGLHDTIGNVWEWAQDCWHESYEGAPGDGSAWEVENPAECERRVVRGGSWYSAPQDMRSASRFWFSPGYHFSNLGIRLARSL